MASSMNDLPGRNAGQFENRTVQHTSRLLIREEEKPTLSSVNPARI